ncbi:PIR protein, partial [Plasmodium ovale]
MPDTGNHVLNIESISTSVLKLKDDFKNLNAYFTTVVLDEKVYKKCIYFRYWFYDKVIKNVFLDNVFQNFFFMSFEKGATVVDEDKGEEKAKNVKTSLEVAGEGISESEKKEGHDDEEDDEDEDE